MIVPSSCFRSWMGLGLVKFYLPHNCGLAASAPKQKPAHQCVSPQSSITPADSTVFYSFFKTLVEQEVTVELKNDLTIKGILKSVDQFLNIKLDEITVLEEEKYPHLVILTYSVFRLMVDCCEECLYSRERCEVCSFTSSSGRYAIIRRCYSTGYHTSIGSIIPANNLQRQPRQKPRQRQYKRRISRQEKVMRCLVLSAFSHSRPHNYSTHHPPQHYTTARDSPTASATPPNYQYN